MSEDNIKLLIVDDHRIVLDGYKNLLDAEGFAVLGCASNSTEAMELYKELKPDVTLMDISMPGKSGLKCIEDIIGYDKDAKIIVCTMYDETQIVAKAIRLGARGFITKTNSLAIMTEAIRQVNAGQYYLTDKHAQTIALLDMEESKKISSKAVNDNTTFLQLDTLSDKELSILKLVAEGYDSKHIAKEFSLSINTVANYRSRILRKVGVKNTRELMLLAIKSGIIDSAYASTA